MVVSDSDIVLRKSSSIDPNGIESVGGMISQATITESIESLWDEVKGDELTSSVVGEYECRCIYIYNNSPNNQTLAGVQVYVYQNTAAAFTDIDIGLGTSGLSGAEQTIPDENSIPVGVRFSFARGEGNMLLVGDIPPGKWYPLWIRRHAGPAKVGSSYPTDNYVLGFKVLKNSPIFTPGPGPGPPPGPGPSPPGPSPTPCPPLPGL